MFHPDILIPATRARLPPALPSAARARRLTASRLLPLLRCRRRHRAWLTRGQRWRCARGKRSFSSTRSRWSTRRACCCPPPPPPRGAPSTHPSASSTCAAPACGSPPPPRWASCAPWLPSTRRAVGCLWVVCPGGGGGLPGWGASLGAVARPAAPAASVRGPTPNRQRMSAVPSPRGVRTIIRSSWPPFMSSTRQES